MAKPKGETTMAIIKRKYRTKQHQKPKVFFQAEVFIKGVRVAIKNFPTRREAILWHEEQRHSFSLSPSSLNDRMLFKDCIDKFWEDIQCRFPQSTIQTYEFPLQAYFKKSPLANVKMTEFKGLKVVEWVQWLRRHPTTKNPRRKSFIKEVDLLITVLNWYRNFLNEDFNVPVTKKHKELCFYKPNVPRRPDYFMRPEDSREWIEWLKEHRSNPVYWKLASFMLLTGARVSEVCGLKWEAVDFEKGIARVVRRVRWDYRTKLPTLEDITKTAGSARILILPKKVQDILLQMKEEAVNELVFTDTQGKLLKYNAVQSAFNDGFRALKLPWRSTHICRHTYATMALMGTNNLSAVQASLGHSQQRMTQRYAKAVALLSSDIGEKTSAILFNTAKK